MGTSGFARWRRRASLALVASVAGALLLSSSAAGADRIYWGSFDGFTISWANVDGSAAADLPTPGAPMDGPMGMTMDPATGRVFWANFGESPHGGGDGTGNFFSYARLDGSGGGQLATAVAPLGPHGAAIDPASGRFYWPDDGSNRILWSSLGGGAGGTLNTTGATVDDPRGVAVDPATGRIYWANYGMVTMSGGNGTTISYANLDGSGGGNLVTEPSAAPDGPEGVAIDPVTNRIYWSDFGAVSKISWASLDGTSGGNLNTAGTSVSFPHGVAIDPFARRIYWTDYQSPGGRISYANLDNSGGGDIPTGAANVDGPAQPVLLDVPRSTAAPVIQRAQGSALACARGSWAPDVIESLLYEAPQSVALGWQRDGRPIGGSSSTTARAAGDYRCVETASNAAGSTSAPSAPLAVFTIGRPKLNKKAGTATLVLDLPDPGTITLTGRGVRRQRLRRRQQAVAGAARKVKAGRARLLVQAKGRAKLRLQRSGQVKVRIRVVYKPKGEASDGPAQKSIDVKTETLRLRKTRG